MISGTHKGARKRGMERREFRKVLPRQKETPELELKQNAEGSRPKSISLKQGYIPAGQDLL